MGSVKLYCQYALLVLLLAVSGCTSEAEEQGLPPTALNRPSLNPEAASLLVEAQEAFRAGKHRAAVALADSASQLAPDLPGIYFLKGIVLTEVGRFAEARSAFEKVLSLDPAYRGVWTRLGKIAYQQSKYREALSFYRKAQASYPSPSTLFQIGFLQAKAGATDSARLYYQRLIVQDSAFTSAFRELSKIYGEKGAFEEALAHASRALELEPNNIGHQYRVGFLLMRTGHPHEAVDTLEKVVRQRPWHYGALYNLGQANLQIGHKQKAQRYLAKADTAQSLQRQIEQAELTARMNATVPARWIELATLYRRTERVADALRAYSKALQLEPNNSVVRSRISDLRKRRGGKASSSSLGER